MRHLKFLFLLLLIGCNETSEEKRNGELHIDGLKEPVEIIRDKWGINHIYANNQHDLFFAQGYAAAKDRLFQFEIWRRQATGTVAEILGERELKRDIGTRLFMYRGDLNKEFEYYHKDGIEIINAFTDGVNAYIDEINKSPDSLPIEFKMLGISPKKWGPEVVISRHQGLLGNINEELKIGMAVAELGPDKVKDLMWFHPKDPVIQLDPAIDRTLLANDILELYNAYRQKVEFKLEDILPEYRKDSIKQVAINAIVKNDSLSIGSNNWVISGDKTADGHTYMANDPHRTLAVPSLRYMAHLVAPGWDVIGGGEPEIPGISIGHNGIGTWGLTVFRTDGEDLYVYDINPKNPHQYNYDDQWVDMEVINETFKVKGSDDKQLALYYTQHGPVTKIDSVNHKAYAVRCAWLEPGGSPYLASLRMDQAKNWEEFREACNYSHIPGENMIWADKDGNIGWQAVGIAPIRRHHSGMVPVPALPKYEWNGYLPISEKPNSFNPSKNYIATANQNVTPETYNHWDAIGFSWSDPYRGDRVEEFLESKNKLNMQEMKDLQVDYLSIPARTLVPYLSNLSFKGKVKHARDRLLDWNYTLDPSSIEAAIYVSWENSISDLADERFIPEKAKAIIEGLQLKKIIDWIETPDSRFGTDPIKGRDEFLTSAFVNAIVQLSEKLGDNMDNWQYGQEKFKHSYLKHALGNIVKDSFKNKLNLGPLPRGGNSFTPGSTGGNERQSSGATFRIIVNTGDWDATIGTNAPGQSGNPDSPFYKNLFESWAKDEYFPVYYSREKIDSVAYRKTVIKPVE